MDRTFYLVGIAKSIFPNNIFPYIVLGKKVPNIAIIMHV